MKLGRDNCSSVLGINRHQYFILIGYFIKDDVIVETQCFVNIKGNANGENVDIELKNKASHLLGSENVLYIGPIPIRWNNELLSSPERLINNE